MFSPLLKPDLEWRPFVSLRRTPEVNFEIARAVALRLAIRSSRSELALPVELPEKEDLRVSIHRTFAKWLCESIYVQPRDIDNLNYSLDMRIMPNPDISKAAEISKAHIDRIAAYLVDQPEFIKSVDTIRQEWRDLKFSSLYPNAIKYAALYGYVVGGDAFLYDIPLSWTLKVANAAIIGIVFKSISSGLLQSKIGVLSSLDARTTPRIIEEWCLTAQEHSNIQPVVSLTSLVSFSHASANVLETSSSPIRIDNVFEASRKEIGDLVVLATSQRPYGFTLETSIDHPDFAGRTLQLRATPSSKNFRADSNNGNHTRLPDGETDRDRPAWTVSNPIPDFAR